MNTSALVLVKNDEYFLPYALESTRGVFDNYVLYNVGSTDKTPEILDWFMASFMPSDGVSFFRRDFPALDPWSQGPLRNAMIAESLTDFNVLLDADEVYNTNQLKTSIDAIEAKATLDPKKLYGVFRRVEIINNFKQAYGLNAFIPHHRFYHRKAIWVGPHPGEAPYYKQTKENTIEMPDIVCYHFHNCARSSRDHEVPKRLERRGRGTYRPGELAPIDILKELPILRQRIEDFPRNPELIKLLEEEP